MTTSKRTTAAELIAQLQKLPPDTPIFTKGYEGGYHDAGIEEIAVVLGVNVGEDARWYYGPHEDVCSNTPEAAKTKGYLIR